MSEHMMFEKGQEPKAYRDHWGYVHVLMYPYQNAQALYEEYVVAGFYGVDDTLSVPAPEDRGSWAHRTWEDAKFIKTVQNQAISSGEPGDYVKLLDVFAESSFSDECWMSKEVAYYN